MPGWFEQITGRPIPDEGPIEVTREERRRLSKHLCAGHPEPPETWCRLVAIDGRPVVIKED